MCPLFQNYMGISKCRSTIPFDYEEEKHFSHDTAYKLTCRDEEDSCTEDDIVSAPVKLTGSYTESPQEQQTYTHDGKYTGGSHSTCTQKHREERVQT